MLVTTGLVSMESRRRDNMSG
jgi:hypothetical protein